MVAKKITVQETVSIHQIEKRYTRLRIIGETGLYMNSMSAKAKRALLLGAARKTAAEKTEIKHNPELEFQNSMHTQRVGPTLLCFPASGVKAAMATAALETPGINKTSVNRNLFVGGTITGPDATEHTRANINIYGNPYLKIDVVRSADMNKTPDMRSRAFLPRWCAELEIKYTVPTFGFADIASLLSNAGLLIGIGDFRQEKGKGGFGVWNVHNAEDMGDAQEEWDEIVCEDRAVQQEAFDNVECYDEDTRELLAIVKQERIRRAA